MSGAGLAKEATFDLEFTLELLVVLKVALSSQRVRNAHGVWLHRALAKKFKTLFWSQEIVLISFFVVVVDG